MPTYVIVDKDKDPLGPNEIASGDTVLVSDGDTYVIDSSANGNITFEAAGGIPADFDVAFLDSNANNFSIKVEADLSPSVIVDQNVDASDIDLDAKAADSLTLNAADNFSFGRLEGSVNGPNAIEIGDGFFTDQDWKLGDANDSLNVGDNATFHNLDAGEGDDTIDFGNGATVNDFDTKDGNDTVTFGDDLDANNIKTSNGDDSIHIGANANVAKVDGGGDNDALYTQTTGLDTTSIEGSNVVCFVSGTRIATPAGPVPVEQLDVGQLVHTADHGDQPIRWIGSQTVSAATLRQNERLRPIRISAGALGDRLPARDLFVSPQHRLLLRSVVVERMFGETEILAAAKHLTAALGISVRDPWATVSYFHILFDRHEIVFANEAPAESFFLGPQALGTLEAVAREEIERVLPGRTASHGQVKMARFCPKGGRRVRWLVDRHVRNDKDLVMSLPETAYRAAS